MLVKQKIPNAECRILDFVDDYGLGTFVMDWEFRVNN